MTPLMVEMYLTGSTFKILYDNDTAFRYRVRREHGAFYIMFIFSGLTQYALDGSISNLTKYRRSMKDKIFDYIDYNSLHVTHKQLDIAVDVVDDDLFTFDIISDKGKYREWYNLEVKTRNRYSKDRIIQGGRFVKDRALYTNQYIVNMYDKGYKNRLDIDIIRIEYKLLSRGIDKITRDNGSIDMNELSILLRKYRILKFGTSGNARRVLKDYVYNINHDKEGRRISDTNYYRKRVKLFPKLDKYMIDDRWIRDVEDVIVDHLYY